MRHQVESACRPVVLRTVGDGWMGLVRIPSAAGAGTTMGELRTAGTSEPTIASELRSALPESLPQSRGRLKHWFSPRACAPSARDAAERLWCGLLAMNQC